MTTVTRMHSKNNLDIHCTSTEMTMGFHGKCLNITYEVPFCPMRSVDVSYAYLDVLSA